MHDDHSFSFVLLFLDPKFLVFFFFNDTATTEIYTLSLHDALPICPLVPRTKRAASRTLSGGASTRPAMVMVRFSNEMRPIKAPPVSRAPQRSASAWIACATGDRSEEHTSELQSHLNLVCRLLLEKKKKYM